MNKIVIKRRKNLDSSDPYLSYFLKNWFPDEVEKFTIDGEYNEDDLEDYMSLLPTLKHKVRSRICLNGFNIKSKDFGTIISAFWYCEYIGFRASNWVNCGKNFLIQDNAIFLIKELVLDYPQDLTSDAFNTMIHSLLQNQHFRDNIKKVVIANMEFKRYSQEIIKNYTGDPWFKLIKGYRLTMMH